MNTAPDFPDLPTLFAQMRTADGLDKQRPARRRFAEIRELARQQSPTEQQAAIDYVNRVQVGLDALTLGAVFVEQGDLDGAVRMFTIAVRHDADGAEEELRAVKRLQAAFAEPGVPDDTVLGPAELEQHPRDDAGVRGISAYTLDWADQQANRITTEARANAAQIVQQAEERAAALIADAKATVERIHADAQVAGNEIRAGSADEVYHGVFVDDDRAEERHFEIEPAPSRADLSLHTLRPAGRRFWTAPEDRPRLVRPNDVTHPVVAKLAIAADFIRQGLFVPPRVRRPARTEPRQAPPQHGLILPYLHADLTYDAAGSEESERWCACADEAPGSQLLIVSFNLRFLAAHYPAVDRDDENWCSAELARARHDLLVPIILADTCSPCRLVTRRFSDSTGTAQNAMPAVVDRDDHEPGVITDLTTY